MFLCAVEDAVTFPVVIAVVGGILLLLQLGDRLYRKLGKGNEASDGEEGLPKPLAALVRSQERLFESQERLVTSLSSLASEMHVSSELNRLRHDEILRALATHHYSSPRAPHDHEH